MSFISSTHSSVHCKWHNWFNQKHYLGSHCPFTNVQQLYLMSSLKFLKSKVEEKEDTKEEEKWQWLYKALDSISSIQTLDIFWWCYVKWVQILPVALLKYVDWLHKCREKKMYKKGSVQVSNGLHRNFLLKLSNNLYSST